MRTPDDCWTRVKVALAELGVDADTVMVGKRSLREELETRFADIPAEVQPGSVFEKFTADEVPKLCEVLPVA
jgi:hypothetical protein